MSSAKVRILPGTTITPETLLSSVLERAQGGHIKSVYIGYEEQDGMMDGCWSQQETSKLVTHAKVADLKSCRALCEAADHDGK